MDYSQQSQDEADKKRQRNAIERDIIMMESDFRKFSTEKGHLEMDIRSLKKEAERARIALAEKQERLVRVDREIFDIDAELKRLKKKMYLV